MTLRYIAAYCSATDRLLLQNYSDVEIDAREEKVTRQEREVNREAIVYAVFIGVFPAAGYGAGNGAKRF